MGTIERIKSKGRTPLFFSLLGMLISLGSALFSWLYLFILKHDIDYADLSSPDIYRRILCQISDTDWYNAYIYIRFYGLHDYIKSMEGEEHHMLDASVDGIKEAEQIYSITSRSKKSRY